MAAADSAASSGGVRTARPPRHRRHHAARSPGSRCSSIAAGSAPTMRSTPARSRSTDSSTAPRASSRRRRSAAKSPCRSLPPAPADHSPRSGGAPVDPTNPDGDCSARARMMLCFAREGLGRLAGTHACRRIRSSGARVRDDCLWAKAGARGFGLKLVAGLVLSLLACPHSACRPALVRDGSRFAHARHELSDRSRHELWVVGHWNVA